MTSPKQPYVNLLFSAAAQINHAQLGQLKEDDRSEMYNHLLDMVSAGANVDLGDATDLVVAEVAKAVAAINPMFSDVVTKFIDAQLGETYMSAGQATLTLLNGLNLPQDWVVFVDPSGDAFAATSDEYQKILNEVGSGGLGELGGKLDALPGFLRDLIASVSARAAEQIFRVVGRAYSNDSGPRSLDQAIWEQERSEEERVDKRRRQREVREMISSLGEFCVCGECEACLARTAQVNPFELVEALEILSPVVEDAAPVNIMVAQQLVVATKAAAAVAEVIETAEELIEAEAEAAAEEIAEEIAEICQCGECEACLARAAETTSDTPAEQPAPEVEAEAEAAAETEAEAAAEAAAEEEAEAEAELEEGVEGLEDVAEEAAAEAEKPEGEAGDHVGCDSRGG